MSNCIKQTKNVGLLLIQHNDTFLILRKFWVLLIAGVSLGQPSTQAQDGYKLVGSADASPSSDCYNLTLRPRDRSLTSGAVWCTKALNISESFELEFTMNLDASPLDSDGIVFVLQTQGIDILGIGGSGIGYKGLQNSFGVEFDTYKNGESADPSFDHIALVRDGNVDHRLNLSFAPPVPILATSRSIKDGQNHHIKLTWNAATHLFQVYVDCSRRITQSVDFVNDVFRGFNTIYWGVTAAISGAGNYHIVCLPQNIIFRDTIHACPTESITLVAGMAIDNNYQWKPEQRLNNPQMRTPQLKATQSQLYTVSYKDFCYTEKTDSVFLAVKASNLSLGDDKQVCENEIVELNPTLTPNSRNIAFKWSTGDTTTQLKPKTSGQYSLTVVADGCSVTDSIKVAFNSLPKLNLSTEPVYNCQANQPIQLNPQATGPGLQYLWSPGASREPILMATMPGLYSVRITNSMSCSAIQQFFILSNCPSTLVFVPEAFTPNGDGVNDFLTWKGEIDLDINMKVFDRWGEIIFKSTASVPYWDGTYKGQPCPSAIYTWRLDYRSRLGGNQPESIMQGKVLLLK